MCDGKKKTLPKQSEKKAYPKTRFYYFEQRKSFWWMDRAQIRIEFNFHKGIGCFNSLGNLHNAHTPSCVIRCGVTEWQKKKSWNEFFVSKVKLCLNSSRNIRLLIQWNTIEHILAALLYTHMHTFKKYGKNRTTKKVDFKSLHNINGSGFQHGCIISVSYLITLKIKEI